MYTEDDEEVSVKNKNSDKVGNDFYILFNDDDDDKEKEVKKKKNTTVKKDDPTYLSDDDDYSDFYNSNNSEPFEPTEKNKIIKIIIIAVLAIILIILLIVFFTGKGGSNSKNNGDIKLTSESYSLKSGEKEYISYTIVGTESDVKSTFTSSNNEVAVVDENGQITAIGGGEAIITIRYTIDGETKEKKCTVKVEGPALDKSISLSLNASTTSWTNKDVTITVTSKSYYGISSLKYAINCNENCNYENVSNNKIVISKSGSTKVTVVAKDKNNQEATKEVTVKIDKEAPTITFNHKKNIISDKDVELCATCSDSLSGCKEGKVCKKFTSTKSNQVITVYDKAGNSRSTDKFNVTINKAKPPCTLKVASDGTVSATLTEKFKYYGFDSKYSGSNTLSKKITISASKAGESLAKIIYYYVKDSNGNKGSCYMTVIKECKCKAGSSPCKVTCTFKAG